MRRNFANRSGNKSSKKNESAHTRDLRIALARTWPGSFWWKEVGGEFGMNGLPDLFGCVDGFLYGFEIKLDGNWFSAIQIKRLRQLHAAGACAGGVILTKDGWMWVAIEHLGHAGDRRRSKWIPFVLADLKLYRSE